MKCLMCAKDATSDLLCAECSSKHKPVTPETDRLFQCKRCETVWSERELIEAGTWSRKYTVSCANSECGGIVPAGATTVRIGGEGSDRQIDSLQKSFRQRFIKKEIDEVRHEHGSAIDDSLRGAEIERIKKEKKLT